jgi:protein O-mannosyl-transferase
MRRVWLTSSILFLATLAIFSRALLGDFVQWDDDIDIYTNPHIRGLSTANLHWIFTKCEYPPRYMPLSQLGWQINYQLGGLNPLGYHLADLVFHAANCVLAFFLIQRLLRLAAKGDAGAGPDQPIWYCSAAGAFLWAVHPLRVETVAWATNRVWVQALFFLILSVLCYLRYQTPRTGKGRAGYYWLSILSFAVSLLSYPVGLTLVGALVVLDFYPLRRFKPGVAGLWDVAVRRVWLEKIPYALLSVAVLAVTLLLRASNTFLGRPPSLGELGLGARAMQAFYLWAYYLWKWWLPFNLSPVYTTLVNFNPSSLPFWLSAAFVIGMAALLVWRRRQWPWALALWACHLVLLIPVLGLTERPHSPADRYDYLPSLLWAVLLAAVCRRLSSRRAAFGPVLACALVLALFWAGLTVRQTGIWRNSLTLFEHTIRELGDDPYRGEIQWRLGTALAGLGRTPEATHQFQCSLRVKPSTEAHLAFSELLERNGDREAALTNCLAALDLGPTPLNQVRAGRLLVALGHSAEAIDQYRRAIAVFPDLVPALNNLAWILATDPDPANRNGAEAVNIGERACHLTGYQYPLVVGTLAAAYAEAGRFTEAIEAARKARDLAQAQGLSDVAERNRQLVELYRAGQPCRDTPAGSTRPKDGP